MKVILNILKVILYAVGFPLLIVMAGLEAYKFYQMAPSYLIWCIVGAGICVLLGIVFLIVTLCVTRKKSTKSIRNQTMRLIICAVVLCMLFGVVYDLVLPAMLPDLASNTLYYEDLVDNSEGQAQFNADILTRFIVLNILNGNYDPAYSYATLITDTNATEATAYESPLATAELLEGTDKYLYKYISDYIVFDYNYNSLSAAKQARIALNMTNYLHEYASKLVKEGINNERTKSLRESNFRSMDKDGYVAFDDCLLEYANSGRMTVPVIVHLILDKKVVASDASYSYDFIMYNAVTGTDDVQPISWSILDMDGKPMSVSIDPGASINSLKNKLLPVIVPVLNNLNNALADDALVGTDLKLYATWTSSGITLYISPANTTRGVVGYQDMAWTTSAMGIFGEEKGDILFAIISLFSARKYIYMWLGIIVVSLYAIGMIRQKLYDMSHSCCKCESCGDASSADDEIQYDAPVESDALEDNISQLE